MLQRAYVRHALAYGYLQKENPGISSFYPRDAMLARVIAIATCLSVCLSVRLSRAGIVSKRRKLAV